MPPLRRKPARATALAREVADAIVSRLRASAALTPWQRITDALAPSGPTVSQARQAFSIAFEHLPGVRAPRGAIDRPADGTLALEWAIARLGQMTPAQRAVVKRWTGWLQAPAQTASGARAAALDTDWTPDPGMQAEAQTQALALGAKLGFPLTTQLLVGRSAHTPETAGAMAVAMSVDAKGSALSGTPVRCFITVYEAGAIQTGAYRNEVFAHEVFHCFQAQMAGDVATIADRFANGTTWWVEGGASWAACNAVPGAIAEQAMPGWTSQATTELPTRQYDGVGFFTMLRGAGIDLWPRWPAIARTTTTATAFDAAAGPEYETIRRIWAAGHLQDTTRGKVWDLDTTLPCVGGPAPSPTKALFLADGTWDSLRAQAYAAQLYALYSDADVLHFNVQNGDVRLSSQDPGVDDAELHDRYFCTDLQTACTCPKNSSRSGPPPPRINADGKTILAVTGGRGGVLGNVQGMTREQYCGVKLGLIVPGRSIGDVYLGQSRRSVLRTVAGLKSTERERTTKNANGLLLGGGGLIGIVFQIRFGLCSNPALGPGPAAAACAKQFPKSAPDQVAAVQTSDTGYATAGGLGPGSDAASVVAAYGDQYCTREDGSAPEDQRPWSECHVPAANGGATTWGFTTDQDGANYLLAVAVFNPKAIPD